MSRISFVITFKQRKTTAMNRRHLLKGMSVLTLYSSFPAVLTEFISSCNVSGKKLQTGFFSEDEFQLIEELTDILIPKTSTPGALEARVPYFIDMVVKDCMNEKDQQSIKTGLKQLNGEAKGTFTSLSAEEKMKLVKQTDEAAFKDAVDKTWFHFFKKLATIGYFTSQEGMSKALNYVKVPVDYKACIPYKKGDKALAKTFLMYW
ncbi:MAG: gluconate 2-dehydrogenase subunit 3 family protein [Lacibacter sp.]